MQIDLRGKVAIVTSLATQIPRLAWEGAAAAGEVTLESGDPAGS